MASWDDVIIGNGEKACSAVRVFEIEGDHRISHNRTAFWVGGLTFIDIGMTIYKSSEEGQKLKEMIINKVSLEDIESALFVMALRNIDPVRLLCAINETKDESFREGRRSVQLELRRLVGV